MERLAASAVAGALVFAAYNNQMLQQIHTRQQALYLNEGRRIGTEALKLSGDDPAMAMLLADAALPENLKAPDRPIPTTEEARSWAAGHLESAHGRRSLTPEELDDYFIPEEW